MDLSTVPTIVPHASSLCQNCMAVMQVQEDLDEQRAAGQQPHQQHSQLGAHPEARAAAEDSRLPAGNSQGQADTTDQSDPTGSHPLKANPAGDMHASRGRSRQGQNADEGYRDGQEQPISLHRPVPVRLAPPDLMAQLSQQLPVPAGVGEQALRHGHRQQHQAQGWSQQDPHAGAQDSIPGADPDAAAPGL